MAPEDFLQWHHYAFAFNAIDGSAKIYLDGAKVTEFPKKGYAYATTWADLSPSITLGTMCYHAADGVSRECFLKNRMFNGLMDDFSLWNFSLSDAEIAQTWNASMAERIADGLEPRCARPPLLAPSLPRLRLPRPASRPPLKRAPTLCLLSGRGGRLVLFYDFNDPLSTPGEIPNLGTAGPDYNALVGKTDGALAAAVALDAALGNEVPTLAPAFVAADAIPNKQEEPAAPLVVYALPGTTVDLPAHGLPAGGTYDAPADLNATVVL